MYEKGKEIKKINESVNNILDKEENKKDDNYNNIINDDKKYIFRKVKTVRETNKSSNKINHINVNHSINESGLVNHIKEVLKGESAKNLMNKLDFTKVTTMKNKLEIFNKNKKKIFNKK